MASLAEKAKEDAPIEISMFKAPECFLYKVPPLKIASGHRAEDWGLGSPQLTGRVQSRAVKATCVCGCLISRSILSRGRGDARRFFFRCLSRVSRPSA